MSTAHVNVEHLRQLQRQVRQSLQEIDQAMRRLQSQLNSADWNDQARRSFEQKLNEAAASVRRANQQLGELNPILSKKISEADRYLGR